MLSYHGSDIWSNEFIRRWHPVFATNTKSLIISPFSYFSLNTRQKNQSKSARTYEDICNIIRYPTGIWLSKRQKAHPASLYIMRKSLILWTQLREHYQPNCVICLNPMRQLYHPSCVLLPIKDQSFRYFDPNLSSHCLVFLYEKKSYIYVKHLKYFHLIKLFVSNIWSSMHHTTWVLSYVSLIIMHSWATNCML